MNAPGRAFDEIETDVWAPAPALGERTPMRRAARTLEAVPDDSSRTDRLASGTRIQGHRILRWLESDARCITYLGWHETLGRMVAIRLLRVDSRRAGDRERALLQAEATSVAAVGSRFVVPIIDLVDDPERRLFGYVMPLASGYSLDEIASGDRFDLGVRMEIARQLCEALAAIHEAELMHGDLRASNVRVSFSSGAPDTRLFGFGRIRRFGAAPLAEDVRHSRGERTAPEQARGAVASRRADLYSLGLILLPLLAPRVRLHARGAHAPLEGVLRACLARDPLERPTLGEILASLDASEREVESATRRDSERPKHAGAGARAAAAPASTRARPRVGARALFCVFGGVVFGLLLALFFRV